MLLNHVIKMNWNGVNVENFTQLIAAYKGMIYGVNINN